MINFLRKVRSQFFSGSKSGQYVLYAIGEIVLVVIGILVALQINNWNEARKERIAEQELYVFLASSLESDLADATDKIQSAGKAIKAQEVFILNSFEDIKRNYSREQLEDLLYWVSESSRSFFPNYGLYDKISNSQQIDLIQSTDLQMKIIELYEQYYRRYNDIDLNLEQLTVFHLYKNYFSKLEADYISNGNTYNIGFDTLAKDYDILQAECQKIHAMTIIAQSAMIDCKKQIESVLSSIRAEMK